MTISSPRMALTDSLDPEKPSLNYSMFEDRLLHVLTTRRRIPTTGWKKRRNHVLIDQYRKYGYLSKVGGELEASHFGQRCLR